MPQTKLEAHSLCKTFKNRTVVNHVSFHVHEGEVVGLLGPNGAGKTTSFYMVVGLLFPDQGKVTLGDKLLTSLPMHTRAKHGISYLPQNSSIFKKLTVYDNLLAITQVVGLPKSEQKPRVQDLLQKFQIEHVAQSLGAALSGGERRRVEIARSLIINPSFLLLDEPFAGVDPLTVQEIQNIIRNLRDDGMGILITDHNVRETLGSCDRSYVLSAGKIIAEGSPEDIYASPIVQETYLGSNFQR
ncbi:MAG: LPS export ABC transporter ATP-binding protein [Oligoflexales bacterium]